MVRTRNVEPEPEPGTGTWERGTTSSPLMHIAFFNRSYYPDQTATGQVLTDLSEDLVREHGCRVSVVVGPPLQPLPGQVVEQRGIVARETRNGVEIHRARIVLREAVEQYQRGGRT